MLALTIREKNGEERALIMDQEDVTIGRAATCDIVLPRNNISKRHARLVDKHDKVVVVDLRSTNGTYVNGRRITAPELLTYDDKVYIGDFVIRLTRPSEQHASQRIVGAFVADSATSSPELDPRGVRLPTQAADIADLQSLAELPPPPLTDAFEPPAAPPLDGDDDAPAPPPPDDVSEAPSGLAAPVPADLDDEAATRAISAAMADRIDQLDRPAAPRRSPPPSGSSAIATPPLPPMPAQTRVVPPPVFTETPSSGLAASVPASPSGPSSGLTEASPAGKGSTQAFAPRAPSPRVPLAAEAPSGLATPAPEAPSGLSAPGPAVPSSGLAAPGPAVPSSGLAAPGPAVSPLEAEALPAAIFEAPKPRTAPSSGPDAPAHASSSGSAPAAPAAVAPPAEDPWQAWNAAIGALVVRFEAEYPDPGAHADLHPVVEGLLEQAVAAGEVAPDVDRAALVEDVLAELGGLGPLGDLERDPSVRCVRVNGPRALFVSRTGEPFTPNGRVFASSRSLRRALRLLLQGTGVFVGEPDNASAGLQEARLPDGSTVRLIEPGGGSDPAVVWRRPSHDVPTLADLEARGLLSRAHLTALAKAARAGENILVCGPAGEAREALMAAIILAYGPELRVVRVGDPHVPSPGLPHADCVNLFPGALAGAAELSALEPGLVVFDPVEGRVIGDWALTALVAGCPVLAATPDGDIDRALRRLALAAELHASSAGGFGARLVAEAVAVAVSLVRGADGSVKVARVQPLGGTIAPATTAMQRP